ncbi:Dicer-like protein 1 [Venturia nashicola]|uniref:Histone H4 n=1 Tax=Venturia nashicola TaxID=86259 RepID=A0A4Z1PBA1_9PEZI|nr:Dicer-like protein 1 [Venturia nashicola]
MAPPSSSVGQAGSFLNRMGFSSYNSAANPQGRGKGAQGLGKGKTVGLKRHQKILRDNIQGVTKSDIRRIARRGGVKRISAMIYDETRGVLKNRLTTIIRECCTVLEYRGRKTVTVTDVIFVLNRLGTPIFGFGSIDGSGRTKNS